MKKIFGFLSFAVVLTAVSCNDSTTKEGEVKQTKDVTIETKEVRTNNDVKTKTDVEIVVPLPPPPPSPKEVLKRLPKPPLPPPPPLPPLPKPKGKG